MALLSALVSPSRAQDGSLKAFGKRLESIGKTLTAAPDGASFDTVKDGDQMAPPVQAPKPAQPPKRKPRRKPKQAKAPDAYPFKDADQQGVQPPQSEPSQPAKPEPPYESKDQDQMGGQPVAPPPSGKGQDL